ncbi:RNA polymerase factor sigma-54 [Paenalcaligenes niemegkensis]|uniref:RNA polymerase factor sigma-54 n=1 Tax=Paenalcaligenes niemegkensis TaxID=2895469 RepID=UPI001EE87D36|nr:RNA polymerase factor sigma-54 [Paenalcaligenes niemegkensis]MCQ9615449.1 RNA polymerase factor sigma-54 [Paenalcaligenes niemegkensis]
MDIKVNLGTQQQTSQSLLISHQAIQAVEILEYGQEELEAFLREQLDSNPLLRLSASVNEAPAPVELYPRNYASTGFRSIDDELPPWVESIRVETSLRNHLIQQVAVLRGSPDQQSLALYLIDSLEPDGYLRSPLEDLAELLNIPSNMLEEALHTVQTLEPVGVGARTLRECLWLQLRSQDRLCPTTEILLANLDLIEQGEINRLAKRCKVSVDKLGDLLESLRRLNPKPGYQFSVDFVQPALPDIIVSASVEGRIRVEANHALLPRLMVDREYFTELSTQMHKREDKDFLQTCLRQANTLVHHLDQRMQTTLKIATEIIKNQADFLYHGDSHLRPLLQKDIARVLGLHESTVSRTIANRYMLCPQGQVPFKHFFSDSLQAQDVAASAIRHRIKNLVASETHDSILSDEAIVDTLQEEGIQIARRTVAKYRNQLSIPSSAQRRRRMRLPWHISQTAKPSLADSVAAAPIN